MKKLIILTLLLAGLAFGQTNYQFSDNVQHTNIVYTQYDSAKVFYLDYIETADVDSIRFFIMSQDTVTFILSLEKYIMPGELQVTDSLDSLTILPNPAGSTDTTGYLIAAEHFPPDKLWGIRPKIDFRDVDGATVNGTDGAGNRYIWIRAIIWRRI